MAQSAFRIHLSRQDLNLFASWNRQIIRFGNDGVLDTTVEDLRELYQALQRLQWHLEELDAHLEERKKEIAIQRIQF